MFCELGRCLAHWTERINAPQCFPLVSVVTVIENFPKGEASTLVAKSRSKFPPTTLPNPMWLVCGPSSIELCKIGITWNWNFVDFTYPQDRSKPWSRFNILIGVTYEPHVQNTKSMRRSRKSFMGSFQGVGWALHIRNRLSSFVWWGALWGLAFSTLPLMISSNVNMWKKCFSSNKIMHYAKVGVGLLFWTGKYMWSLLYLNYWSVSLFHFLFSMVPCFGVS